MKDIDHYLVRDVSTPSKYAYGDNYQGIGKVISSRKTKSGYKVYYVLFKDLDEFEKAIKNPSKRSSNPGVSYDEAVNITKGFHGREPIEEDEVVEIEHYDKNLGELFTLLELNICHSDNDYDDDSAEIKLVPIDFQGCGIKVGTNKGRRQLYFIGGDQSIDLDELEDELGISLDASGEGRQYVNIGEVYSIAYHTDKHHLQGPKNQKNGVDYEHTFGEEENGEWPELMYDRRNKKIIFVGGSYEVRDEGLWN